MTRDLDDDGWLLRIRKAKTVASVKPIPVPARLREMLQGLASARVESTGGLRNIALATVDASARPGQTAGHLFVRQDGLPMSRYVARDRVRAVLKAAGVPVLPPQALRRTFTDIASMQGIALTAIADMAGHESTAVTQRSYASPERIEAAKMERHLKVMQGGVR